MITLDTKKKKGTYCQVKIARPKRLLSDFGRVDFYGSGTTLPTVCAVCGNPATGVGRRCSESLGQETDIFFVVESDWFVEIRFGLMS